MIFAGRLANHGIKVEVRQETKSMKIKVLADSTCGIDAEVQQYRATAVLATRSFVR